MIEVHYQDKYIILLHQYEWTGKPDGVYFKYSHPTWGSSTVGGIYKALFERNAMQLIQISNEHYQNQYAAVEPLLIGDVLILGGGLQELGNYLSTGTSWKWVENHPYLASFVPIVGTMHEGDAEDIDFLTTLGTFDTILIDFKQTQLNDYSSLLNPGGTVIEFKV